MMRKRIKLLAERIKTNRALIGYVAIDLLAITVVTYPLYFRDEIDKGGLLSLAFTIALATILPLIMGKRPKDAKMFFNGLDAPSGIIVLILMGTAFVALWLSVRIVALYALRRYLLTERYGYNPYQILETLSSILACHLCFTIAKTVKETAKGSDILPRTVNVAIQAFFIGIITILPKYGGTTFPITTEGVFSYVCILLTMGVIFVLLIFLKARYIK